MFLRLSLSSVCVFFLSFTSTTTFAINTFQQTWSGLDDEAYIERLQERYKNETSSEIRKILADLIDNTRMEMQNKVLQM